MPLYVWSMQLHPGFVPLPSMLVPICTYHSLQSIEHLCDSDFLYILAVHTLYSRKKGEPPHKNIPSDDPQLKPTCTVLELPCLPSIAVVPLFRLFHYRHLPPPLLSPAPKAISCHPPPSPTIGKATTRHLLHLPTPL